MRNLIGRKINSFYHYHALGIFGLLQCILGLTSFGQSNTSLNVASVPLIKNCKSQLSIFLKTTRRAKIEKAEINLNGAVILSESRFPRQKRVDFVLIPKEDTVEILVNKELFQEISVRNLPNPKLKMYVNGKFYQFPGKIHPKSRISFKFETEGIREFLCDCVPIYRIERIEVLLNYTRVEKVYLDYEPGTNIKLPDILDPQSASGQMVRFHAGNITRENCDGSLEDLRLEYKERDMYFSFEVK